MTHGDIINFFFEERKYYLLLHLTVTSIFSHPHKGYLIGANFGFSNYACLHLKLHNVYNCFLYKVNLDIFGIANII